MQTSRRDAIMTAIKKYLPGEFCWTDLGTTNVAAAKKFYKSLFGWTSTDFPMGVDSKYTIFQIKGKDVCALYPMMDEQKKMKAPPAWIPFINVKSVDGTIKKAKAAGGKTISPPMDVGDMGRMAVVQDPTHAMFSLWQAHKHPGAQIKNVPGTVCWQDLNTPKPAAAAKFYTKVVGWKVADQDFSGNAYHLFKIGKVNECGMWPEPMKKLPPSWITYWQVADCAKSVAKVKKLGGKVLMGTTVVPEMCSFAIFKDPQGAVFGVLEPEM
jgi:predicted enzyme related to lactoylglutathione lyase